MNVRLVALLTIMISATLAFRSPCAVAQENAQRGGIFSVHLESDQSVYRVGDPIRVKVTIHNNTADRYAVHSVPPWIACELIISGSGGRIGPSSYALGGYPGSMLDFWDFTGGRSLVIGYDFPTAAAANSPWADIKDWGYSLSEPGIIPLVAVPLLEILSDNRRRQQGPRSHVLEHR